MTKAKTNIPSPPELSILKVIWAESPLSAREIHDQVASELTWSFSSTRKTLDRMQEKTFVVSKQLHGVRVFSPKLKKLKTLARYGYDFARRVLELDGPLPVSMFVDSKLLTEKEIKELQQVLNAMDKEDAAK